MKKVILTLALLSLACAGTAAAAVGWAGNVWPNSGTNVVPTGPVDCYVQVWKDGVTNMPGPGADLEVYCDISNDIGGILPDEPCAYQGEVGANDEYTVQIPQAMLVGASTVTVQFKVHDLTDDSWYDAIGDQAGNPAPQTYNVIDVLPNDVDVTFTLCMSGEAHAGAPFVVGSNPVIGEWCQNGNLPVQMTSLGGDLYEAVVTFPAGGNPYFEYKYQKVSCDQWEGAPNRAVTLPTDGTTSVALDADSWNNLPIGCGLGEVLDEAKEICFQVCLDGVDNTGGVCIVGNIPELDSWGAGIPAEMVGPGLYQACVIFPAGSPMPIAVEYKAKKDDCATWEGGGNRMVTVDNGTAPFTTLTHTWEDGAGQCAPVGNENSTFSDLKARYR